MQSYHLKVEGGDVIAEFGGARYRINLGKLPPSLGGDAEEILQLLRRAVEFGREVKRQTLCIELIGRTS